MDDTRVVRTKMAAALLAAVKQSAESGHNPGRVGRVVLTNNAKGVGIKFKPREQARKDGLLKAA